MSDGRGVGKVGTKSYGAVATAWRLTRKDLLICRRYIPVAIILFLAYGSAAFVASEFFYVACAFLSVAIGICPIFIDSRYHGDLLFSSLPIRRGWTVGGRYISNLLIATVAAICSVLYGWLLSSIVESITIVPFGRLWMFIPIIVVSAMLLSGIFYPFYFRYGLGKGSIVFGFTLLGIVAVGYATGLIVHLAGSAPFASYKPTTVVGAFVASLSADPARAIYTALAISVLYLVSGFISTRLYRTRDF